MPAIEELEHASRSLVLVDVVGGFGAGSVIAHVGRNSYVLTCQHVVGAVKTRVTIRYRKGKKFADVPATVERVDEALDLALVRTTKRLPMPTLAIGVDEPERYERVYGIGCGSQFFGLAFEGMIVARDGSAGEACPPGGYIFTGLSIGGMSGGPLIDDDGVIVGVITAVDRNGHLPVFQIGHAMSLPKIREFIAAK